MPTYVVERFVERGDIDEEAIAASARRAADAVEVVAYRGSIVFHADELCFCMFEAPSMDAVRDALARAGLAFERVSEATRVPNGPAIAT